MRKNYKFILPATLTMILAACASKPNVPEGEFLIQGKLTNVPDSTILYLYSNDIGPWKLVASDTVLNGVFTFRDTITTGSRKLGIKCDDGFPGDNLTVWVASGQQVNISSTDNLLIAWSVTSDIPEQEEENKYSALTLSDRKELINLYILEEEIIFDIFSNHRGDEAYGKANWSKVDSIRDLQTPIRESIDQKEIDYMKTAPINGVWMQKLLALANTMRNRQEYRFTPQVMELFARMSDSDKQDGLGNYLSEYVNLKVVNIGDDMVDSDLYDVNGNKHHLSEHKGKYILLDFWSQGCGPCRQSVPELEEVTQTYKDNLAVIGINIDRKNDWMNYVKETNMQGLQWNELRGDENGLDAKYQLRGIPHYIMISPEGKIIDIWNGYGQGSIKKQLKALIK